MEELQTLRHGSLKRGHPSEDKGDPWFLREPDKKLFNPYHRVSRVISSVRKISPDNEGSFVANKGNIQMGNVLSALEYD